MAISVRVGFSVFVKKICKDRSMKICEGLWRIPFFSNTIRTTHRAYTHTHTAINVFMRLPAQESSLIFTFTTPTLKNYYYTVLHTWTRVYTLLPHFSTSTIQSSMATRIRTCTDSFSIMRTNHCVNFNSAAINHKINWNPATINDIIVLISYSKNTIDVLIGRQF